MDIEHFLMSLEKVRKSGEGSWTACCPNHKDNSPSLSISDGGDGRILVHCFGGCPVGDVVASAGFTLADLMPENVGYHHKTQEKVKFNPYDVLRLLSDDLTHGLLLCKAVQRGDVLNKHESLQLAKIIGRISAAIQLAGGKI